MTRSSLIIGVKTDTDARGTFSTVLLAEQVLCAGCGRPVSIVINRGGLSVCVECDARKKEGVP